MNRDSGEPAVPIEIRELHIRVSVDASSAGRSAAASAGAPPPGPHGDEERRALVAECVEQVLQVLRDRKER